MVSGQQRTVLSHLHRILDVPDNCDSPDRLLLERFVATRDEDAFAALVRRHRTLVWGVCWRSLRHIQDAEDSFQATFVVLARKASSVQWHQSVANWLYGVAARVAAEARAKRTRRHSRERQQTVMPEEKHMPDEAAREFCAVIDEELTSLPQSYRAPLLMCYLEGRTTDQAALQLGWSQRTLERRLAQGRERLRARLTRRGLTLSGVLLGVFLGEHISRAAVPAGLVAATIRSATSLPGGVSGTVLSLAATVTKGMAMTKLKLAAVFMFLLSTTVGAGMLLGKGAAWNGEADQAHGPAAVAPEALQPRPQDRRQKAEDKPGVSPGDDLARRTWAILEVVEKNHVQPPPRRDVILKGTQALLKAANAATPEDLAQRISAVSSEEQLRTLLREIWPKDAVATKTAAAKLEKAWLDGLLKSIPGRSHLQSKSELSIAEQLWGNRYVGSGLHLVANEKEQLVQILIPFRRGPARRAGALPGDLILDVDGKSTLGIVDAESVAKMLRGPEGSSVSIVVRQPGATESRTLRVTRTVIPMDSMFGFKRAGEEGWDYSVDAESCIAYVWVMEIKVSTPHELRQLESRLRADGMRALVLDFRFCQGGGFLRDAALVAGGLLDGGLMWTTRDARNPPKAWRADNDPLFRDWPLAVLINDAWTPPHAAVLAALQDNRRAILVGEPSKADGAIHRLFDLPNEDGKISVLTGQSERSDKARGWPVCPDRTVELSKEQRAAVERWLMAKRLPVLPPGSDDRAPEDPQLASAVALLRDALKGGGSTKDQVQEGGK